LLRPRPAREIERKAAAVKAWVPSGLGRTAAPCMFRYPGRARACCDGLKAVM